MARKLSLMGDVATAKINQRHLDQTVAIDLLRQLASGDGQVSSGRQPNGRLWLTPAQYSIEVDHVVAGRQPMRKSAVEG